MNKIVRGVLMAAAGGAAFVAVKTLKQETMAREPTAVELKEQMDAMAAEAARKHPGMAKSDRLKEVAVQHGAEKLAKQSGSERATAAADMFFGFFFMNTKLRPAYCAERGVNIAPFVKAFTEKHSEHLARAKAIYAEAGADPEANLPTLKASFASFVEQDMKDVATGAEVPLEAACDLFKDNAQAFADALVVPPHIQQGLTAN